MAIEHRGPSSGATPTSTSSSTVAGSGGDVSATQIDGHDGPVRFGFPGAATNFLEAQLAAIAWADELSPFSGDPTLIGQPHRTGYVQATRTGNIVAQWLLDETGGTVAMSSWLNAQAVNGAVLGAEGLNAAVPFAAALDGSDDFLLVDTVDMETAFAESFAWRAWINGDSWANPINTIVGQGPGAPIFYVDDAGRLALAESGGSLVADSVDVLAVDSWHHVGVRYVAGEDVRLYVDGVDVTRFSDPDVSFDGSSDDLALGSATGQSASSVFDGRISDVAWLNGLDVGDLNLIMAYSAID